MVLRIPNNHADYPLQSQESPWYSTEASVSELQDRAAANLWTSIHAKGPEIYAYDSKGVTPFILMEFLPVDNLETALCEARDEDIPSILEALLSNTTLLQQSIFK